MIPPLRSATRRYTRTSIVRLFRLASFTGLLLAPLRLAAQEQATTGIIRGTVLDSAGVPIRNSTIRARNVGTNFARDVVTNALGSYAIPLVPLGSYEITARAIGYSPARQTGVSVRLGATANVSFTLTRRTVALSAVQVTGEKDAIDASQSAAATELSAKVVEGLPNNGRNFLGLVLLTPNTAIVQGPDGDELSIAGQRGIHNNISVDGADFNNPFFGEQRGGQRPAFTFNLDAVQDMVVVASGANAEFGRSGGGFVNVVTKSGTNTVSGTAHYFGKSQALASNYSRGGGKPDFQQQQFGFTLPEGK